MFCVACGANLPDDARFCLKCGREMGAAGEPVGTQYEVCDVFEHNLGSAVAGFTKPRWFFEAVAIGPQGRYSVAQTPQVKGYSYDLSWRRKMAAALNELVSQLVRDGWQPIASSADGLPRFQRRVS
jgi:hypothetical protein